MVEPRTESEAEAGLVPVRMGGQGYSLPALTIEQSEEWQATLGAEIASLDDGLSMDDEDDVAGAFSAAMQRGTTAMLRTIESYDITAVLGGLNNIRTKMTPRQAWAATEAMLDSEFPFDTEGRHSVGEMFGLPLRALGIVSRAVTDEASRRAKYPSSPLPSGVSLTPKSASNGRGNNSSSAGATVKSGRKTRKPTG